MKKIIAVVTLLLAFSVTSNAQSKLVPVANGIEKKELSPEVAAKNDALELQKFLELDDTQTQNMARLFEKKYTVLREPSLSDERKAELSRIIEAKLRATLSPEKMEKLEKNKDLMKRIIY